MSGTLLSAADAMTVAPVTAREVRLTNGDTPIRWLEHVSRGDVALVGGKGANLGEMTRAGLPVPAGFVVTAVACDRFLVESGLFARIEARLATLDVNDGGALEQQALEIRQTVIAVPIAAPVQQAIRHAYAELAQREHVAAPPVAVRSSATAEDTAEHSFAGMHDSFLDVRGEDELLRRVRDCWASAFGARALFYRRQRGLPMVMPLAVVVQRMVDAEKSGVIFTVDPTTGADHRIVVEAAWGLGEVVVGGEVTPDHYVVDKRTRQIAEIRVARKSALVTMDATSGQTVRVDLAADPRADARVLTDGELRRLGEFAVQAEAHYGAPQDMEFAIEGSSIAIVQTRPVTTLAKGEVTLAPHVTEGVLLHGLGASPGQATGRVRIATTTADARTIVAGEILVAHMTSPDWVPVMRRAAAIVTDAGGMTSHAAIVARELGLPCIVGTQDATTRLRTGMLVTVDGSQGEVRPGEIGSRKPVDRPAAVVTASPAPWRPVTATRIYVNLGDPEQAEDMASRDVDGVGLLRAEFMIPSALEGVHPRAMVNAGHGSEFVDRMSTQLRRFARAFAPRPVIYRAMDFRSNELRGLAGGEGVEPREENPMIGYRGCYRYVKEPDLFALELEALHRVRVELPNLHLMIPFVRTGWEFRACKRLIDRSPLAGDRRLELWVMAEVPSVVTWMDEYVALGATGVSIGSNDLTQLVLGVDRDSDLVAPLFDERDPAVLAVVHQIIRASHRLGITCSICGQAPSVHPDYAARLVRWGIDSISVNPDAIERTRRLVAEAEQRVLLDAARGRERRGQDG